MNETIKTTWYLPGGRTRITDFTNVSFEEFGYPTKRLYWFDLKGQEKSYSFTHFYISDTGSIENVLDSLKLIDKSTHAVPIGDGTNAHVQFSIRKYWNPLSEGFSRPKRSDLETFLKKELKGYGEDFDGLELDDLIKKAVRVGIEMKEGWGSTILLAKVFSEPIKSSI